MIFRAAVIFILALALAITSCATLPPMEQAAPSLAEFDRRAERGDALNVVFFGASLTWGSNASDPNRTSCRALLAEKLREKYPRARFRFIDAALGGTGSQVAVFRLERDVLPHNPDLVFLDFSLNDDYQWPSPSKLAAYESVIRRILTASRCPIVVELLPGAPHVAADPEKIPGRLAHLRIARAYNLPVGDAVRYIHDEVASGRASLEKLWPFEPIHPGDEGYRLYAHAVWNAFNQGVADGTPARLPEPMLHGDGFMTWSRTRLSSLGPLPKGWSVTRPNVQAAYYDGLMSRWLDDETRAAGRAGEVEPFEVKFRGSFALLFGERTMTSGKVRVLVDGTPVLFGWKPRRPEYDASSRLWGNNQFLAEVVADGLDPAVEHTLRIEPLFEGDTVQEFRIESICVAGPGARVWR